MEKTPFSRKRFGFYFLFLLVSAALVLNCSQGIILANSGEIAEESAVRTLEIDEGEIFYLSRQEDRILRGGEQVELIRKGEPYDLPADSFNYWQDGEFAQLVYPLLITGSLKEGRTDHLVYHLEEDEVMISASQLREELAADWERITVGEPLMIMDYEIKAQDFTDSLLAKLSPGGRKLFLSLQHYMIATMRTAVAVMDRESGEIDFVPQIIERSVSTVFWSPEAEYLVFTVTDARGYSSLYIVGVEGPDVILSFPDFDISEE